eukprot:3550673-Rhodomonas_salina.1
MRWYEMVVGRDDGVRSLSAETARRHGVRGSLRAWQQARRHYGRRLPQGSKHTAHETGRKDGRSRTCRTRERNPPQSESVLLLKPVSRCVFVFPSFARASSPRSRLSSAFALALLKLLCFWLVQNLAVDSDDFEQRSCHYQVVAAHTQVYLGAAAAISRSDA